MAFGTSFGAYQVGDELASASALLSHRNPQLLKHQRNDTITRKYLHHRVIWYCHQIHRESVYETSQRTSWGL